MPKDCLRNLYFALVYPHLLYGIELYANTCKSFLTKLLTLNNKLLRILQFAKIEAPVLSLYASFNILPLNLLFQRQLLLFMYKFLYCRELIPRAFHNYFILNVQVHNHDTRSKSDLHLSHCRTSFGKRCLQFQASQLWNSIPLNLKIKSTEVMFKTRIYSYLLSL